MVLAAGIIRVILQILSSRFRFALPLLAFSICWRDNDAMQRLLVAQVYDVFQRDATFYTIVLLRRIDELQPLVEVLVSPTDI